MTLHSAFNTKARVRKEALFVALAIISILLALIPSKPFLGTAFSGQRAALLPSWVPGSFLSPGLLMSETVLSKGKFLVASEGLTDPNFSKTVVLLVHYDFHGAMGLVINRPTDMKLSSVFPKIEGLRKRPDTVYIGGPVARGQVLLLIRSQDQLEGARRVFDDISVSASRTVLRQMIDAVDLGKSLRVYSGHAGWAPGQLDQELSRGGWHVLPADADIVFHKTPSEIWPELIRRTSVQWVRAGTP
jgi:putative transcriptional regulator